jgi:elongation factor P
VGWPGDRGGRCAIISRRFSGKKSNLRGAMAETISTNQFRNGAAIRVDGKRFTIMYFQHVKPGKGGAFVRTRLRNLDTGAVIEKTFRANEKVESVRTESRPMQFLYRDGDLFYFMDSETYEQLAIPVEIIGEAAGFIAPNGEARVLSADGEVVSVEPPAHVDLEVAETDPGLKGDTATGGSKPATLETGVVVQVPLFVNVGERVRVDTRTNEYLTRV